MFSWYEYLIALLVLSHLGFWSGNLFLIAPFPDLCLLVPFNYFDLFNVLFARIRHVDRRISLVAGDSGLDHRSSNHCHSFKRGKTKFCLCVSLGFAKPIPIVSSLYSRNNLERYELNKEYLIVETLK